MDEITVEGVAGIISADAAAGISLLRLERVTAATRVARLGTHDDERRTWCGES